MPAILFVYDSSHMSVPRLARALCLLFLSSALSQAQTATTTGDDTSATAKKAAILAKAGRCDAALPLLEKSTRVADNELRRKIDLAGVRCSMTLARPDATLHFLGLLAHDFPHDPEVLYTEIHAYSDLSTQASQILATSAPNSPQAHELLAESFEGQGKWDDAEKEYRQILAQNSSQPGIHFKLGRLLLSKPNPPATAADEAKHQFEQELAIDPSNAGAEYVLGELARQNQSLDEAVKHFAKAAKLDPQFSEAFVGLGTSLIALKRYPDAVSPLETAVKLEPRNPDAHYQLATAYTRAGRKEDGQKEFAIHQKLIGTQGGAVEHAPAAAQPPDGQK